MPNRRTFQDFSLTGPAPPHGIELAHIQKLCVMHKPFWIKNSRHSTRLDKPAATVSLPTIFPPQKRHPENLECRNKMPDKPEIICIGSVLWDVIGRSASHMRQGSDVAGRISRLPGGVALNIAMTLRRFHLAPALLSTIGTDDQGRELLAVCKSMGLNCDYIYISQDLPTDRYMAIEGANGLIAAIADAHSLEISCANSGAKMLRALGDGRLGTAENPFGGVIALDGNLTQSLLEDITHSPLFRAADLRVAPASPGKAERLTPLLNQRNITLYVNLEEAGLLCQKKFKNSVDAVGALIEQGTHRVLVTDGAKSASVGTIDGIITQTPPQVLATRITGAGDTFMAAHIAAEMRGDDPNTALANALQAAATYVSGEIAL